MNIYIGYDSREDLAIKLAPTALEPNQKMLKLFL